ncbi:type VII secretion target [Streptomyces sp. NBC_01456]|uniref:type VII secretion target n=1 Tax=unclassified Streptomyces TaxID=2593676 RepID=UPI002E340CC0|nr:MULTISPECIES: type VII secretion target [unclassified Streptomyces]
MSSTMSVQPGELRASAHAQGSIAEDIKKPSDKAVSETGTAADSAKGWSVAAALHMVSETWQPALDGLHKRLLQGAANLRDTADNHDWNEDMVDQDFEDFNGDKVGVIMSAPASGSGPGSTVYAGLPHPGDRGNDQVRDAVGEYQPPPPGTPSPSTDDMMRARPAMPVYDPGEALTEPGRGATPRHTDDNPFG